MNSCGPPEALLSSCHRPDHTIPLSRKQFPLVAKGELSFTFDRPDGPGLMSRLAGRRQFWITRLSLKPLTSFAVMLRQFGLPAARIRTRRKITSPVRRESMWIGLA